MKLDPTRLWPVLAAALLMGCLFSGGDGSKPPGPAPTAGGNPKDTTAGPVVNPPIDTSRIPTPQDSSVINPPKPDTGKPADTATQKIWLAEALAEGWSTAEEWNSALKPGQSRSGLVWTRGDSAGVKVHVHTHGLYRRTVIRAFTAARMGGLEASASGLLGGKVPLDDFPAIGMMNPTGSMVAGGNTIIDGKVLLTSGSVRQATESKIRFTGDIKRAVAMGDSSPIRGTLPLTFADATEWILLREADFTAASQGKSPARDSLRETMRVLSGDTVITGRFAGRLLATGRVSVSGDALLEHAEIWAENISIEGPVTTRDVLLYGRSGVSLAGEPDLEGQFLSRDSMSVRMRSRHTGNPVFYVNGWYSNQGYASTMDIQDTRSRGLFLVGAYDLPLHYSRPTLILGDSSRIDGLLYTNSNANFMGEVHGSAICEINRFEYQGTIYLGHTLNAAFIGFQPGETWIVPPIFALGIPAWASQGEAAY